jgi:heme exporter protein A
MARFEGENLDCVRGERLVFAGLSFGLAPGGALVLEGRNGSGKTSLLRLMAGLARPAAGRVGWDGGDIRTDPEAHRARTRYIGHLDAVKPQLTVSENVAFWAAMHGGGGNDPEGGLAAFGLQALGDTPARFLSAGQRRRLALARLVAAPAPLWLLDEPTIALDREAVDSLLAAIARHRATGGMAAIATNVDIAVPGAETLALAAFAPPPGSVAA